MAPGQASAETLEIGIGTQNTTTNTVTGGVVLKELGLLEKHLPKTGKYKDIEYKLSWQNATSGPPITNGMMANNIQIGMMGDYPLMVNGATGQATKNETQLVAIIAYNALGGGNGIVVHKDSPYYELADLKGKNVSVPFGSAAHGMMLTSLQKRGLPPDFWSLVSQSPEVGSTNLQEKRIDAHGDFVPFAELLPFKGFARKIYDGAETKTPTFHGVVVRKDFGEKYPEIVVAYIEALDGGQRLDAQESEARGREDRGVDQDQQGSGLHLPRPRRRAHARSDHQAEMGRGGRRELRDPAEAEHDQGTEHRRLGQRQLRAAGLQGTRARLRQAARLVRSYNVTGTDPVCNAPVDNPAKTGEIWIQGGDIVPFSSPVCTLLGVKKYTAEGKKFNAVYLVDHELGIKVFADAAFYSVGGQDPKKPDVVPFLLKKDAEAYAAKNGGKLATYTEVLAPSMSDNRGDRWARHQAQKS